MRMGGSRRAEDVGEYNMPLLERSTDGDLDSFDRSPSNSGNGFLKTILVSLLCIAASAAFVTFESSISVSESGQNPSADTIGRSSREPHELKSKVDQPAGGRPAATIVSSSSSPYRPKSKEVEIRNISTTSSPWNESAQLSLRTAFHFQPIAHWMNDPDAPLYYQGWYHLFYQYNPVEAFWGLISWGHAVSDDLIHWLYLDLAMVPDHSYDYNGVWTGSATFLKNGTPAIIYTGSTNESVQVQNVAFPEDPSDPLLRNWTKISENPVMTPPRGINDTDFRDPTTAWLGEDGLWTLTIGSQVDSAGIALLYKSSDFLSWTLQDHLLHQVNGTGMWECVDFYPVAESGDVRGLDTSASGEGVKHVLKASMDDTRLDFYTIGTYNVENETFTPDDPSRDITYGFRYDYGRYYASKSFYDPAKQRRILFGWINESDTMLDDIEKGWAGVQALPRQVWFDNKTRSNLIQWPVEDFSDLRGAKITQEDVLLESGSVVRVEGAEGAQLDVVLIFSNPLSEAHGEVHVHSEDEEELAECSQSGAAHRGVLGPFGLLVLSADDLEEQTAIYFYLSNSGGTWTALVCNDLSRSSLASDLDTGVYGGSVIVLEDEDELALRVIVDHSIVETFVQGGRTTATTRVYPTIALDDAAHLFVFNNGTMPVRVKSLEAWQIHKVYMHDFFSSHSPA